MPTIKYRSLDGNDHSLNRSNSTDAGMDLRASKSFSIEPLSRQLITTGIALEIPEGFYGRIAPRSGLALKYGIDVLAGVIDSSYRGEILVLLYNTDKSNIFKVDVGDRIAQIIIEKHYNFDFVNKELSSSIRSDKGFGSSGNK